MPTIGNLGTMFVRDKDGRMVPVPCIQGKNGITPHIGENGNWWIGDTDTGAMADNKKYPVSASVYEKIFTGKPSEYTLEILLKDGERIRAELPNMGLTNDDVVEIGTGEPSEFDDINYKQFYLDKNTGRLYTNISTGHPAKYIPVGNSVLFGKSDPTNGTAGNKGELYINTSSRKIFLCTSAVKTENYVDNEWIPIGGGSVTADSIKSALGYTPARSTDVPVVDSTLTKSGQAADAAIVGQKLTEQSEAIVEQGKTIPKVFDWAKAETKPTYDKTEVGLGNVDNVRQYSKDNPPPYPVTAVNGKTGNVSLNTSDLNNNSGFITNAVADLANYYAKSQTYNRDEINERISAIPKFAISVVSALPTSGISTTTIYLVNSGSGADLYTEYIYIGGAWEILGAQRVDLTGYATEAWVNAKIADFLTADNLTAAMVTGALGFTPANGADVPAVDSTLKVSGAAADAKAVGDKLTEVSGAIANKLDADNLTEAINTALAQAKESGEFDGVDGAPGENYVLTEADKTEIAEEAARLVDVALLNLIGEVE